MNSAYAEISDELRSVAIQVGTAGEIQRVTSSVVARDQDGNLDERSIGVAPEEAALELPVRIETAWWSDGKAGTDLSDVDGKSGRVAIQLLVSNLTANPTEIAFESNGARYRQNTLVGVPLTVVATANLGKVSLTDVIGTNSEAQSNDRGLFTDGVISTNADGEVIVQWTRLLAPPVMPPTTAFTLVVDTDSFTIPGLDVTVHPGLISDSSVNALLVRGFGAGNDLANAESSTIQLLLQVNRQLEDAIDFVDEVHQTLQGDVTQISAEVIASLKTSSETVLGHLEATLGHLKSLQAEAGSGISQLGSQAQSNLNQLGGAINTVLGSTNSTPSTTGASVKNCQVKLPVLTSAEETTVVATIKLLDAQLQTIQDAFGEQSSNCTAALIQAVTTSLGDPSELAGDPDSQAACEAATPDDRSVACALYAARTTLNARVATVTTIQQQAEAEYADLSQELSGAVSGTSGLAATLDAMRAELDSLTSDQEAVFAKISTAEALSAAALDATAIAKAEIDSLTTSVLALRNTFEVLSGSPDGAPGNPSAGSSLGIIRSATEAGSTAQPVGAWFTQSGFHAALDTLVQQSLPGCPADWDALLGSDPSADEVNAALEQLNTSGCAAQQLAVAVQSLVTEYQSSLTAAGAAYDSVVHLTQELLALDAAISQIESVLNPEGGALYAALTELYDDSGPVPSGQLVQLSNDLSTLKAMVDAGPIPPTEDLTDRLRTINDLLDQIWPDSFTQPIPDRESCLPEVAGPIPTPAAQRVVYLSNLLACQQDSVSASFDDLGLAITTTGTAMNAASSEAEITTQTVLDASTAKIGALSSQLEASLALARDDAIGGSLNSVDHAKLSMSANLTALLEQHDLASSQLIATLADTMTRAGNNSTEVSQSLKTDFTNLMINLGGSDAASRTGLVGKLYGITATVGDTGVVLDKTGSVLTSHGNARTSELRGIDMRAAQFDAAVQRLTTYSPFGSESQNPVTVFIFHVAGQE